MRVRNQMVCLRGWAALLAAGGCVTLSGLAAAEETTNPARALFSEARKLVEEGKYQEACPKFEESLRLEVGIGTQFNLANCWEHIGRTASAHALFLGAAASAKAAGQADREQVLRERAIALEPRLSKLVIEVNSTDPKLKVKRNELPLENSEWGKAIAVDPGSYTITAKAPGKRPWEKQIEVKAGTAVLTVEVPELEPAEEAKAVAVVPKPKPAPKKPAETPTPKPLPNSDRGGRPNYEALGLAGVGVGALVVGTVMGFKYMGANDDAKKICPTSRNCTLQEIEDHDQLVEDAKSARTWSYVGFGVGGFALAGAPVLWYLQKSDTPSQSAKWQALPLIAPDGRAGAALVGSF